jgi:PKD repeat protein
MGRKLKMKRVGWKNRLFVLTTLVLLLLSPSFGMTGGNESAISLQFQQENNMQMEFASKQQSPASLVIEPTSTVKSEPITTSELSTSVIGTHKVRVVYYGVYIYVDHDSGNWPHEGGPGEWRFAIKVDLKDEWGFKSWSYEPPGLEYYPVRSNNYCFFDEVGQTRDCKGTTTFGFTVRAIEYDLPLHEDYKSRLDVTKTVSSYNSWRAEGQQEGDVKHYYRYIMYNRAPVANSPIAFSGSPYEGNSISYFLLEPAKVSDPDGDGIEYQWDQYYTPGSFSVDSTSSTPTFTYNSPGQFTLAYRVKDALGAYSNIYTQTVYISNVAPTATFSNDGPKTEGIPVTVSFTNQYDPGDADTFTYSFDWDNDGIFDIVDQDEPSATYTWYDSGIYTVRGRITDDYGLSQDYTTSITVEPPRVILSINNGATKTTSMSVLLTISPTGSFKGVDEMRFRNEGEAWTDWESFALSKNWMLPLGDGLKTVYIQVRDAAGKIGESFDDILLDTTLGTHNLEVTYYAAVIYDSHDIFWISPQPGEWKFVLTAGGDTAQSSLYSRSAGYFDFPDLTLNTSVNGPIWPVISVAASEWDDSTRDYLSPYTIPPPSPILLDHEYIEDIKVGDVRHYFKFTLHNTAPTANPITGGTIFEGQSITLQGIGDDPDGDSFECQWDKAYDGVTFDVDYYSSNPTILYATPGTYTVAFRTVDAFGKASTIQTATVEVIPLPPTLTLSGPSNVPEGVDYTLSLSASGPGAETISEWTINWGDGTIQPVPGDSSSITHTYADGLSTYTISATATTAHYTYDADNTLTVTVTNVAPAAALINDGPLPEGSTATVSFIDQYDPSAVDILSFTYSFDWDDDGTYEIVDQTSASAQYTWFENGDYPVRGKIQDKDGGYTEYVTVVTVNDMAPTAVFAWIPEAQAEGSPVDFIDASASYPDDIVAWSWDFDGQDSSTEQNPSFTFMDDGIYDVTLTVTDHDGSTDTFSDTVTVINVAPTVDAGADQTVNEGSLVTFAGSFTDPGTADTHTYEWDFGDGSPTATTLAASHIYADDGIYTVTLTVTDDDGGVGTDTLTVTVMNVAPTVVAGLDQTVDEGTSVTFIGSFTDPGADTHTYQWDFGDGTTAAGTLTPAHIYADDGVYTVTLTVTDDDGGVGTATLAVTVLNVAPTVSIDSIEQLQAFALPDLTILILDPAIFTGSATDPGADTLTYSWAFGDGVGASGSSVTHSYGIPGTYPVILTVTDDDGGIGTASVPLTVWGPRDLKTSVISDLEALKTGEWCLDKRLDWIIWSIERSLNEKLWVDETHLDSWYGQRVFFYEMLAEIHLELRGKLYNHFIPMLEKWIECLQAKGYDTTWLEEKLARMQALIPVFEAALFKLAKADELLARVAIIDAENTPVQNSKWQAKVDCYLAQAAKHLAKAADRLEDGHFASAICHYKLAWMSAQQAMKWANKTHCWCCCCCCW